MRMYGARPTTSKAGVFTFVTLSVDDTPLSLPPWRSGAEPGAEGEIVSIVTLRLGDAFVETFPASSTALIVNTYAPPVIVSVV
jgi:hypothetical protein